MGLLAIAYNDLNGNGFSGNLIPWIISDFDNMDDVLGKITELKKLKCKNITLFTILDESEIEEISWEYVKKNKIEEGV